MFQSFPHKKTALSLISFVLLFAVSAAAQQTTNTTTTTTATGNNKQKVNFGYSQNPKTKVKKENQNNSATTTTAATGDTVNSTNNTNEDSLDNSEDKGDTLAVKTFEIAKRAANANLSPTEIYKVGSGDVLFISLLNAPSKASSYFTVLNDGTIDYPLAGEEMLPVAGMTTDEIEELLREKIKLYENPQVSVKVREHASHAISVLGLVEKAGEKYLQREAIPLYVVRAEAVVQAKANRVVIKRASNSTTESFDLSDKNYENVLVFPGDIIEFTTHGNTTAASSDSPQFFYIGGNIASAGQKDFYPGMTLTQAVLASGGLKKSNAKKVIIRRKNSEGILVSNEYNLKDIKDGKTPDPTILAGDTIEIGG